jgi:hypothetical protein
MELVNVYHELDWSAFDDVVKFLEANLYKVIQEVHGLDKLIIDDGQTQINCPPPPEAGDSHGALLLRTLSEKETTAGVTLKREFKVHGKGPDSDNDDHDLVEIREDVVRAGGVMNENVVTVSIARV